MKPAAENVMWVVLLLLYVVTRLTGLTTFPIFSDEAMFIHLGQILSDDFTEMPLFRKEGKHPLFMWFNAVTLQMVSDPLAAGRMVSVLAGAASLWAIFRIGRDFFSLRAGLVAGAFYVFCPYTLFFDRLALVDSLLCATGVWMVYTAMKIAREDWPARMGFPVLGIVMALSFWTKGGALLLFPAALFVFPLWGWHRREGFWKQLTLSGVIATVLILPLFVFGKEIGFFERTAIMQLPMIFLSLKDLFSLPWLHWMTNASVLGEFYLTYLTLPVVVVMLFALGKAVFRGRREERVLVFWALFPPLVILLFTRGFYSRYFLIAIPPLLLLAAAGTLRLAEFVSSRLAGGDGGRRIPYVATLTLLLLVVLSDGFFLSGTWFGIR